MPTISEALAVAIQHHQAGRLHAAEQGYREILRIAPDHADATHLLGVIAHQAGNQEAAARHIRRAIELNGNSAGYHFNLANVYHALSRLPEAADCSRRALELRPGFADAHLNLGIVCNEQGNLSEAADCFLRVIELQPSSAEAHNNLGAILMEQGKPDEAVDYFRRALELNPGFAEAYNNLGNAFKKLGNLKDAIRCLNRAVELKPGSAAVLSNLSNTLKEYGNIEEAVDCARRAVSLSPELAEAHLNLGVALTQEGKIEEAIDSCRRALELRPDFAEAHRNLGVAFTSQGKIEEAVACCRRALRARPNYPEAEYDLAIALLLLGRFEEGQPHYESRLALLPSRNIPNARWNGGPVEGQTILLHCEQGFGDSLQFMRYAAPIRERAQAARVILECQPKLARLFAQSVRHDIEILARDDTDAGALPNVDWHLPLLSAPFALRASEPLPMPHPYLRADPEDRAIWRKRLGPAAGKLRVGLAWQGNPSQGRDRFRSLPPEQLLPLLQLRETTFYRLQLEAEAPALERAGLVDLTSHITDFADTAALMAELDLIISVDTAIVHLAGALGRPIWNLLTFVPHWPWGLAGETTAWYPTMRLFRQAIAGDWDAVVRNVADALAPLCLPHSDQQR